MTCFLLSCMHSLIQPNFIECILWPRHGAGLVLWHMQGWNKTHCSSQASLSGTKKSRYWLRKLNYPGRQWFRMKQGTAQMSNESSVSGTGSELPCGQGLCWGVAESPVQCLVAGMCFIGVNWTTVVALRDREERDAFWNDPWRIKHWDWPRKMGSAGPLSFLIWSWMNEPSAHVVWVTVSVSWRHRYH